MQNFNLDDGQVIKDKKLYVTTRLDVARDSATLS